MSVIIKPKAAYHSIYFGAPCSAPDSIKSKSKTRFIDAIPTTKTENKIPVRPLPNKDPIKEIPKKDRDDILKQLMEFTQYVYDQQTDASKQSGSRSSSQASEDAYGKWKPE